MITLSQVLQSHGVVDRWPLNVDLALDKSGKKQVVLSSPGFQASYLDFDGAKRLSYDLCIVGEVDVARRINSTITGAAAA